MQSRGKMEVLQKCLSLFVQLRCERWLARHQTPGLAEDPWIADATTSDRDTMHARVREHQEDVFDRPDVTASEDQFFRMPRDEILEKWPASRTLVLLLNRPAMNRHP